MIFYDQLIPGSVLLGYLNADHWAVAIPINRIILSSALILSTKTRSPEKCWRRRSSGLSRRIWPLIVGKMIAMQVGWVAV
jgi:hypothetical protein